MIEALRASLTHGGQALADIPALVRDIIARDLWQRRPVNFHDRAIREFTIWEEFVRADPPAGLGQDPLYVAKLCRGHADVEAALASVAGDNITGATRGTARIYALHQLRSKRPDLLAKVTAGKMTPHAAMLEAGLRQRMISVPDDPARALAVLMKRFGRAKIVALLNKENGQG